MFSLTGQTEAGCLSLCGQGGYVGVFPRDKRGGAHQENQSGPETLLHREGHKGHRTKGELAGNAESKGALGKKKMGRQ